MRNQAAAKRAHWLAGASFLFVGLAIANWPAHALDSTGVRAVPTYEAAGLYWSNPGATSATGCEVKFRKTGDATWTQGLAMWFDARNSECRGSIVGLTNGTSYEAQLNLPGQPAAKTISFSTWANAKPVTKTIKVASGTSTLNISEGGSESGYVVYDGTGSTLDAQNAAAVNISVNASFVIVRGFTLKGAQQHGILIDKSQHDVIVEDNDISGWGRTRDGTWGADMDSGIRAICVNQELTRVTIQRNKIHDPRYGANSWDSGHPAGPQGLTFSYCGGNNVYRWNEIYSNNGNKYNDPIGGEDNYSTSGFPNKDSDIYGNKFMNAWDDGIEADGGNMNVRIWGNYMDDTGTGISTTLNSVGPSYLFRNIWNRNRFSASKPTDADDRQPMMKAGSSSEFGNGRRYVFHNTMLQPTNGSNYPLGGGAGIGGTGNTQLVHETISMNNTWNLYKPNSAVYQVDSDNKFQSDMFNGSMGTAVISGINATPQYAAGNGNQNADGGMYQLAAGTPGFDTAVRIPNFNDAFVGAGPDVGAAEAGAPAMKFGLAAADATPQLVIITVVDNLLNPAARPPGPRTLVRQNSTAPTSTTSSTTPTSSPTGSTPTSSPGITAISLTMDSSSYTVSVGQSVTFTVRLIGNGATPTGTVVFKANDLVISDCASIAAANGQALCTTTALAAGSYRITGTYSGDSTYTNGVAGPITQTVK